MSNDIKLNLLNKTAVSERKTGNQNNTSFNISVPDNSLNQDTFINSHKKVITLGSILGGIGLAVSACVLAHKGKFGSKVQGFADSIASKFSNSLNSLTNKQTEEVINLSNNALGNKLSLNDKSKIRLYQGKGYFQNLRIEQDSDSIINPELLSDIRLMYKHIEDGVDIRKLFTPSFDNIDIALKQIKIGDICEIKGSDKISIKISDDVLKELNLSPDTYLRLFPPCDRYAFGQQRIGDCYLVSALYNMEANPKSRSMLLSCFNEIENGVIEVKFPKGNKTFKLDLNNIAQDYTDATKLVTSCDGIKSLEYLYGLEKSFYEVKFDSEAPERFQECIKEFSEKIVKCNTQMKKVGNSIDKEGTASLTDLMNIFCEDFDLNDPIDFAFAEHYLFKDSSIAKFISLTDSNGKQKPLFELLNEHEQNRTAGQFLKNLREGKVKLNLDYTSFCKAKEKEIGEFNTNITHYKNLLDNYAPIDVDSASNKARGNGGRSNDLFEKFGLKNRFASVADDGYIGNGNNGAHFRYPKKDEEYAVWLNKALENTENDYLLNAGTKYIEGCDCLDLDRSIVTKHAYTIKPIKSGDEIRFLVTNPWNNAIAYELTKDELFKYFNHFFIAKL